MKKKQTKNHDKRKKMKKQSFPSGWNEKKVRAVVAHYDNLTDDELAREIEDAEEVVGQTNACRAQ